MQAFASVERRQRLCSEEVESRKEEEARGPLMRTVPIHVEIKGESAASLRQEGMRVEADSVTQEETGGDYHTGACSRALG